MYCGGELAGSTARDEAAGGEDGAVVAQPATREAVSARQPQAVRQYGRADGMDRLSAMWSRYHRHPGMLHQQTMGIAALPIPGGTVCPLVNKASQRPDA